ncbi:MAG: hypothetical protein ACRCXT_21145 [Paraclostridium sp.]
MKNNYDVIHKLNLRVTTPFLLGYIVDVKGKPIIISGYKATIVRDNMEYKIITDNHVVYETIIRSYANNDSFDKIITLDESNTNLELTEIPNMVDRYGYICSDIKIEYVKYNKGDLYKK